MDRIIIYPSQIPFETDLLSTNQNAMVALGVLAQAVLGSSTVLDGLACTPTTPASLNVQVGPGSIYAQENLEATAYSSLLADTTHQIMKQGIVLDNTSFSCPAPATSGQSVVYLVQAQYQDEDTGSEVLEYYNSSDPTHPYSGPANAGTSNFTVRRGLCALGLKTGVAATTGTQTTPSPDAGYTGLYAITVANGQTTITSGNIQQLSTAPFIAAKLPAMLSTIQSGAVNYAADTSGAANTITISLNPAPAALVAGMRANVKVANSVTGATVMNTNGLGNVAVKTTSNADLSANAMQASGVYTIIYDGNHWQLQGFAAASATGLIPANNLSDVLNAATSLANLGGINQTALNAASPLVGQTKNLVMKQASSTTANVTVDEVIVESSLGGSVSKIASLSVTLNIATTGLNAMDTGSAPANGFLSVYAITGPGKTPGVLACNAATSSGTIYSGSHMPSGYTQSALIGSIPTNGSSQLPVFTQLDKEVFLQSAVSIFTNVTNVTSLTSQSIAAAVPPNAKSVSGQLTCSEANTVPHDTRVAADASGTGLQYGPWISSSSQNLISAVVLNFRQLPIITSQTMFWQTGTTGSSLNNSLSVTSYTI